MPMVAFLLVDARRFKSHRVIPRRNSCCPSMQETDSSPPPAQLDGGSLAGGDFISWHENTARSGDRFVTSCYSVRHLATARVRSVANFNGITFWCTRRFSDWSIVRVRGRDWIVLPSTARDTLLLKAIGPRNNMGDEYRQRFRLT